MKNIGKPIIITLLLLSLIVFGKQGYDYINRDTETTLYGYPIHYNEQVDTLFVVDTLLLMIRYYNEGVLDSMITEYR